MIYYNPKVLKEIYGFELKLAKRVRKVKEDEGFQGKENKRGSV